MDIKYVLNAYNSYVKVIKVVNALYVDKKIGFNFNKMKLYNSNDYLLFQNLIFASQHSFNYISKLVTNILLKLLNHNNKII